MKDFNDLWGFKNKLGLERALLMVVIPFTILIATSLLFAEVPVTPQMETDVLDIKQNVVNTSGVGFNTSQNNFSMPGSNCFFRQINHTTSKGFYYTSYNIQGNTGTVRIFKDKNSPIITELKAGPLPQDCSIFITTDKQTLFVGPSYNYKYLDEDKDMVLSLSQNTAYLKKIETGWNISYKMPQKMDTFSVMYGAQSTSDLFNFGFGSNSIIWGNHDFTNNSRILLNGYYYKTPTTYIPYHKDSFWHISSNYLVNSLIRTGGNTLSTLIGNAQMIMSIQTINEKGFIPTLPQSSCLDSAYQIKDGFFDTRFNGETLKSLLNGYQKYQLPGYKAAYLKMADYYMQHSYTNHFLVKSNDSLVSIIPNALNTITLAKMTIDDVKTIDSEGWLVYDYSQDSEKYNSTRPNQSSLNHQIAAVTVFLMLYEEEKDDRYLEFANTMLRGITLTTSRWIMADDNLEYAYMPNDTMGLIDYPYLTYNDLFDLKVELNQQFGISNESIEKLLDTKLKWMIANKVTGSIRKQ